MKSFPLFIFLAFSSIAGFSQTDYDKQIEYFGADILKKIEVEKKRIAIVDFKNNDDNVTQFSRLIAEDLSSELAIISGSQKGIEIVDRNNLEIILNDLKLSSSKDESKIAKELGRKAIADYLITGTVTTFGDNYRVSIKVLDSKTGNIVTGSRGLVVKTTAIEDLHRKIIIYGTSINANEAASKNQNADMTTKIQPVTSVQKPINEKGWIDFENKSTWSFYVYISTDQTVQSSADFRYTNKPEQTFLAKGTSENLPSLKPGVYYICACVYQNGTECQVTKKVEVQSGKGSKVNIVYN